MYCIQLRWDRLEIKYYLLFRVNVLMLSARIRCCSVVHNKMDHVRYFNDFAVNELEDDLDPTTNWGKAADRIENTVFARLIARTINGTYVRTQCMYVLRRNRKSSRNPLQLIWCSPLPWWEEKRREVKEDKGWDGSGGNWGKEKRRGRVMAWWELSCSEGLLLT